MKKSIIVSILFVLLFMANANAQQEEKKPANPKIHIPALNNGGYDIEKKDTKQGYGTGTGSGYDSGLIHGNYSLSGRKLIYRPTPLYNQNECNEEGTVVLEIIVDKTGKIIEAKAGVRGTTNTAKCLVDVARQATLKTKFDSSETAPDKQVGTITYNFKIE